MAAERGIFCLGFMQFTDEELRNKFDWIAASMPDPSRAQLEEAINRYKLARQETLCAPLSCDAQMIDRDTCQGWDEFTDEELAGYYRDWFGQTVEILHEESSLTPPPPAS